MSINITSNNTAAGFIGGGVGTIPDPTFQYAVTAELGTGSGACNSSNEQRAWTTIDNTANSTACNQLFYNASNDRINISVAVGIPEDAAYGGKSALVTITATQASY